MGSGLSARGTTTLSSDELPKTSLPLDIVVVGCGLGGLAAAHCLGRIGHRVTILEQAPAIGEIGAGIQISPNVTRLLKRWGVGDRLDKAGIRPRAFVFHRYSNGEQVGWSPLGDQMVADHGEAYYHVHRADVHRMLYDLAAPYMTVRLNARVASIDPAVPSLTLHTGEVVHADLVIAADGVKSMLREVVVGGPDKAIPTGDAAYRAIIPTAEMAKDPELKWFVDNPQMNSWMGPGRHIMMYKIRPTDWNVVMAHPDDGAIESWTAEGDLGKMREVFKDFEPRRVQKMLDLIPRIMDWRLMDREPLPKWVHDDGKVALLGDACHPMLPYRAQGAAMAIEDAAVLGVFFVHITDRSQIGPLLHAYEKIRYPRTSKTQLSARSNQRTFHYEDGPEQVARDNSMRQAMLQLQGKAKGVPADNVGNANQWADKRLNQEQFNYDAELEAEKWWRENGGVVLASAA
ncbi:FAD/NAD(P)-binding domain-containing protein [Dentipellis sp. KUC8613]|nr:FAD/NAD(P)-binding domain-containing protein [Dentipellis sp. KUC8613]